MDLREKRHQMALVVILSDLPFPDWGIVILRVQ